jgi:aminodeoxychorismate synthase component I
MMRLLLDFEGRRLQGARPFGIFESKGGAWHFASTLPSNDLPVQSGQGDIWGALRRIVAQSRETYGPGGGAIGYLAYDLARTLEPRAFGSSPPDDLAIPDIRFTFYEALRNEELPPTANSDQSHNTSLPELQGADTDADYLKSVQRILDYISAGDIYQANLTRRFVEPLPCSPAALYERLQSATPMPHAALLEWDDFAVVSHSPERFLRIEKGVITAQPIKGTRPRGQTAEEDARLRTELADSAKDRAENVMIVDLLRNDLGRVCEYGSISVPELFEVHSFPTLHHGVSTVTGKLRANCDLFDALQAAFPCGSITGAPKIRAMQIIDDLEPVRRGVAMGAVGWLDLSGNCDWNVAIRTVTCIANQAYFHVGGGIVADSTPDGEAAEIGVKARAIRTALAG